MNKEEIRIHNIKVYEKYYHDIISNAKKREYDNNIFNSEITEVHHIVPRCMNGDNSDENLVRVTIREHIMLHLLLTKIYYDNPKIIYACHAMMMGPKRKEILEKRFSTRTISLIKEQYRDTVRKVGILRSNGDIGFIPKAIICYNNDFEVIREYYPAYMCEIDGFYKSSVCRACRGQETFGHKYANYNWMYTEDFIKLHPDSLIKYRSLVENNNPLPELDTSYNRLSNSERLVARKPQRKMDEEWKRKISKATTGIKKNISREKFHAARIKAYNTMKQSGNFAGRKRIPVETPDGKFNTLTDAGNFYGVTRHTIKSWIEGNKPGFKYLK